MSANEIAYVYEECHVILGDFAIRSILILHAILRCEWVVILGFSPVMYTSSNWGGCLHCSHGWCSSDWWSQLL